MKPQLRQLGCAASLLLALAAPALTVASPNPSAAVPSADEVGIRQVMMSTWDTPQARLDVGPVVVVENRAVAGWTQGERGGRAFLTRDAHGQWQVSVCGGDGLKDAKTLVMTGMSTAAAQELARKVEQAEANVPAARRALFATFEGMLRMDGAANPPPAHSGTEH